MDSAKLCERIVFSENPGLEMRKIRQENKIKQKILAKKMGITPQALLRQETVRKNIGANSIRRFVEQLERIPKNQLNS